MRYFPEKRPTVKIYLHQYGKKELKTYSVYARVLYKRKKLEFSLRMKVAPCDWDFDNNLFIPNRQYNIHCNQRIGEFRLAVDNAFDELKRGSVQPTLRMIREVITGKSVKSNEMSFLKYYDQTVEQKRQQTTVYRQSSIDQYLRARNHLFDFLVRKGWINIQLGELSKNFINEFENYLLSHEIKSLGRPMMRSSAITNLKRNKAIVNEAVRAELIEKNPFEGYKVQHDKTQNISYLTQEQLKKLEDLDVSEYPALVRTRELFQFICQCGLRYGDFQNLRCNDLEYSTDGLLWLRMEQQKTRGALHFPLSSIAKKIILKYKGNKTGEQYVFPRISNQILNKHLRTMKIMANIKNQISCHVGRHTFAVQSLDAGISIEVLQRLLGHKSISSTMIYAQISHKKLSESILL
ncbi:MAG: site-specific integrase, partial [Flavobacteriales bacterium]|nr:site-specific integrase [Flavobacteriales bacterium]